MNITFGRIQNLLSRHAIVGIGCSLLNIGIIYIGTSIFNISYLFSVFSTIFITIPISYFLHRRFSFRIESSASILEFFRFLSQQFFQFSIGVVLLVASVEWMKMNPTLGMTVTTLVLWIFSFIVQYFWVFKSQV